MTFHTSCPVVRRTKEEFVQWVVVGGERQKATFSREIVWLLESESVVKFLHGGELLMEGGRSNDFYGLLSSTDASDRGLGLSRVARQYGITQDSSLLLVLETRVFERPVTETAETIAANLKRSKGYKAVYAEIPNEWRIERVVEGEARWPMLENVEVGSGIVWTSKNDDKKNEQLRQAFASRWLPAKVGAEN